MLKFAIDYAEELKRADRATWRNPKYKWYNTGGYDEEITIENNSWNKIQMVSVNHEEKVIGYFTVDVDRANEDLFRLKVINYVDKCNPIFARDMYEYFYFLFVERGARRMEWGVVIGNPIEKMYDRFCKKVNGNIIGIRHKAVKLMNGQYADTKVYEVFGDDVRAYLQKR